MKTKSILLTAATAIFYLLFCALADYHESVKEVFSGLMLFLPGLTFPLSSTGFYSRIGEKRLGILALHIITSVLIYHGAVWIFSAERVSDYISLAAGFAGSALYLIVTRVLLHLRIVTAVVIITSLVSGLAFLPYIFLQNLAGLGLSICIWTMANYLAMATADAAANMELGIMSAD